MVNQNIRSESESKDQTALSCILGGLWAQGALLGSVQGHQEPPAQKLLFENPSSGFSAARCQP